jgi:hypothetical protein
MMTNFTIDPQNTDSIRRCISDLTAKITTGYQQAQPVLRVIEAISPPPEDTFSLREEIELLTADLSGYASQLQVHQEIANPSAAITHLQSLRLFSIPALAQPLFKRIAHCYFETSQEHPQLKESLPTAAASRAFADPTQYTHKMKFLGQCYNGSNLGQPISYESAIH